MKTIEEIRAELNAKSDALFDAAAVKKVYGVDLPEGVDARVSRNGSMTQIKLRCKDTNRAALLSKFRDEPTWQVGGIFGFREFTVNGPVYRKVRGFASAIDYGINFCKKGY